jgi:hypothetical protein
MTTKARPRTRRAVLMAIGKIAGVAAVGSVSGTAAKRAVFFLWDKLEARVADVDVADLFPEWRDAQVVPGRHHPVDGFHPDIVDALRELAPLIPRADLPIVLGSDADLPSANPRGNLVLIGGPISNVLSSRLHGHHFDGRKISVNPVTSTSLRWHFHYPFPRDDDPPFSRYVGGSLREKTMAKALVDSHSSGALGMPRFSKVDNDTGRIESDLLLITVLPNTLGSRATGATIIDVADLQGQGDKAFAVVLQDHLLRRELYNATKGKRYFQALYHVPVLHDDASRTTRPGMPQLADIHVLA